MRHLVLTAAAAAVLGVHGASAADLPRSAPAYESPAYAPVFTWTGFYAGLNGGYGFGSVNGTGNAVAGDPSGGFVGGTIGYNYQYNQLVLGLEADFDFAGIDSSQTSAGALTTKSNINFVDTIRARAGYAVNRTLFYVTGGYAGANAHATVYDPLRSVYAANSSYLSGYAVGAGVEYAFMPNLSGKVEYLYTDLGGSNNFAFTPDATRINYSISEVRAGINYHF